MWRRALRGLTASPLFTLAAVASLAIGIGANTAIFTLLDQLILRPLPVPHPHDLVILDSPGTGREFSRAVCCAFSYPAYRAFRDASPSFTGLAARYPVPLTIAGAGPSERIDGELVSGNFFEVLGARAHLGRTLAPADDLNRGAHPAAVLSHAFWKRRFGASPSVLGQTIRLNGHPYVIIGVAAERFTGVQTGTAPAVYLPLMMKAQATPAWDELDNPRGHWLNIIGRLRPGVTRRQALASLQPLHRAALEKEIVRLGGAASALWRERILARPVHLLPGAGGVPVLSKEARAPLTVLMTATGLVLLIACANVAGLLIARAIGRRREMAVRLALGASGFRLAAPILAECLILVALGTLAGLLLAAWMLDGIFALFLEAGQAARLGLDATLNTRALLFSLAAASFAAVLFAIVPAAGVSREDLARASASPRPVRLRKLLVAAEIALSLFLLVTAGLFTQTLSKLHAVDLGFPAGRLLTFQVDARLSGYAAERIHPLYESLRARLAAIPGVGAVAVSDDPILSAHGWTASVRVHGRQNQEGEDLEPYFDLVSPGYFQAIQMPLLAGREFTAADNARAPRVAIVNDTFARYFFGGASPLGRRFDSDRDRDIEIVGVVRGAPNMHPREPATRRVFLPYLQRSGLESVTFYVRTDVAPEHMFGAVRRELAAAAPDLPMFNARTVAERLDITLTGERLLAWLCAVFAAVAALLSAIGIYGVVTYAVAARTREIGVRIALGAGGSLVVRLILRDVALLAAAGAAAGLALVLTLGRAIRTQLHALEPYDPITLIAASALLAAVTLLAAALPARHAARVNPVVALRHD